MKRIYRILALFAVSLFSFSCTQDPLVEVSPDDAAADNEISFVLGNVDTRAGDVVSNNVVPGVSFPLYTSEEEGIFLTLDEEITDLNLLGSNGPETRGVPALTSNVATLYGSFKAVVPESATAAERSGVSFVYNGTKWKYSTTNDPWGGDDTKDLDFYMWMPETSTGVNVTGTESGAITFSYTSPAAAVDQKDILFTTKKIKKSERTGQTITFYHALTGVRFRIGNPSVGAEGKKIETKIKSVKLENLNSTGTCTVNPTANPIVTWTSSTTATYEQAFGDPITVEDSVFGTDQKNDYNLNASDGSLTFYLIPQNVNNVVLTVTFTMNDCEVTSVLSLGNVTWTAGQLRTYTINAKDVNVHVEDEITSGVKENVTITNTGNINAYIRAAIIGNWCAPDGSAVFGYTDFLDSGDYIPIPSWTIENTGGGVFAGLATATSNWVRKSDGYFYYTLPVAPGESTASLFTSYTPGDAPDYQIAGKDVDTHFVMEIATQAIEAKDGDGGYQAAWAAATTTTTGN